MNRNLLIIICSILMQPDLSAQSKWVFENYNYWGQPGATTIVPIVRFESKNNWHAELRYNYEDLQTLSVFGGHSFSAGKELHIKITPLAGYSIGKFTGFSAGVNADVEWKDAYVSTQSQYSVANKASASSFFFTWSELGYDVSPHFFTGVAFQYTLLARQSDARPGLFIGLNLKGVTIPFYVFSPFADSRYFVLGLNYELNLKKRK